MNSKRKKNKKFSHDKFFSTVHSFIQKKKSFKLSSDFFSSRKRIFGQLKICLTYQSFFMQFRQFEKFKKYFLSYRIHKISK